MSFNNNAPFSKQDPQSRRSFLSDVSRGMIAASVGAGVASDLGFSTAFAETEANLGQGAISFGKLEPLITAMQETPLDRLQNFFVTKLRRGEAGLKDLTAAGALANARTFGGEDYEGFHSMFALIPALEMSAELPKQEQPLPVLKVLYRNSARMQAVRKQNPKDKLQPLDPAELKPGADFGALLREATRKNDKVLGDRILAALVARSPQEAYEALQVAVQDKPNVHGVALAHRAWEVVDLVGMEHAHTLLRQSVHFCAARNSGHTAGGSDPDLQKVLERQLDRLDGKKAGTRKVEDEWVLELAKTIYESSRSEAADAVGEALHEGVDPEAIGEALSLAANELLLRQLKNRSHGDSRGVHASDAVNAWRNIARVTGTRNRMASLIVAGYHVGGAGQRVIDGSGSGLSQEKDSLALFRGKAKGKEPAKLLAEAEEAILSNNQRGSAAAILNYSQLPNAAPRPVFNLLLKYAVSEDGRLHGEKYYRTVTEEFATIRPSLRWRELIALARVTSSCYGLSRHDKRSGRAPGYLEARELLGLG